MGFAHKYRNELGLLVGIVVVLGATLIFNQDYLEKPARNARDILHLTALLGIFSLGAAIVIIAGGIDLSSGSVIVFSGSVCGLVMMLLSPLGVDDLPRTLDAGLWAVVAGIAAAIVAGLMIGTFHAWLITVIKLPPFVATLASLVGLRSLATIVNQTVTAHLGERVTKVSANSAVFAHLKHWWVALIIFLVLAGLCWLLMSRTVIGRHIYAMGGNEEAARLSGVRIELLQWLAYCIGAVTASIAGVLYVAKIGSANPSTLAVGYELNAIAAAVVGGCSLQGGVGLIPGVVLGVLFLRVVIDAIAKVVQAGSDDYQGLIVGILVVLAVAFNEFRRQTAGAAKEFFPGWMGVTTIPILALLLGTVTYVLRGPDRTGLLTGLTVGVVTLAVLAILKWVELNRTNQSISVSPAAVPGKPSK